VRKVYIQPQLGSAVLTKELGHPVLLSESTLDLLRSPSADLVYVTEVTVRGRSEPARV